VLLRQIVLAGSFCFSIIDRIAGGWPAASHDIRTVCVQTQPEPGSMILPVTRLGESLAWEKDEAIPPPLVMKTAHDLMHRGFSVFNTTFCRRE
jgi:hypothetical protein